MGLIASAYVAARIARRRAEEERPTRFSSANDDELAASPRDPRGASAASEAIRHGSRAAVLRRSGRKAFRRRTTTKLAASPRDPRGASAASGAIRHGSRAAVLRRSGRHAFRRRTTTKLAASPRDPRGASAASGAIRHRSRAAVLARLARRCPGRAREQTRFSSASE